METQENQPQQVRIDLDPGPIIAQLRAEREEAQFSLMKAEILIGMQRAQIEQLQAQLESQAPAPKIVNSPPKPRRKR